MRWVGGATTSALDGDDAGQANRSHATLLTKFRQAGAGQAEGYGLKVFP